MTTLIESAMSASLQWSGRECFAECERGPNVTAADRGGSEGGARCGVCGEVVGVYEPLIVLAGDAPRLTSLAREPDLAGGLDVGLYHEGCYRGGSI
jgi:hypothetical protein